MLLLYSDYSDVIETSHCSKYCSKCMQELYTHVAPYTSSSVSVNMELTYGSDSVDREGPKVMSVTVYISCVCKQGGP